MAIAAQNITDGLPRALRSFDGCLTCRKRKVKCDEVKPQCSACSRLGRICNWRRQWKFKDSTALVAGWFRVLSAREDQHQSTTPTEKSTASLQWCRVQSSANYLGDSRRSCSSADTSDHDWSSEGFDSKELSLPPEMNNVPSTRLQLLNTALSLYLPSEAPNHTKRDFEIWLNPDNRALSSPRSPALKAAIEAFGMAQAALTLREARLASSSVRRYVAGVAALRSALSSANESTRDETILAMLLFQLIEVRRLPTHTLPTPANVVVVHETDIARRWLGGACCWCYALCREYRPLEAPRSAAGGLVR